MREDDRLFIVHVRLLQRHKLLQPGGELIQRNDRIHQYHLHHLLELGTGTQQSGVLLLQPVGHLPFHHPVFQVVVVDHVLFRMVVLVRDLSQVVHRVPDQEVADWLFIANGDELVFEQRQQPGDIEMVLVQTG
ncbi:hypothetical protein LMBIIBHN_01123 [Aeromonas salmonicida]